MKNRNPMIVLGCGFSGTNVVVAIIKDEFNFFMGSNWMLPKMDINQKYEIWEDVDWYKAVNTYDGSPFHRRIETMLSLREHFPRWGFKFADIYKHIKELVKFFDTPHFILCDRDTKSLTQRMIDVWAMNEWQAEYRVEEYRAVCKVIRDFYPYIDIDQQTLLHQQADVTKDIGNFIEKYNKERK